MKKDMNEILISFIIPIYNTSNYLKECVNSITKQVTDGVEIILVNDGSTDDSLCICKEIQREFKNIVIIDKENGGLSSARNAGLEKAKGEYVFFLDSDDRISECVLKDLVSVLKESSFDLCFFDAEKFYPDGGTENLGDCIHCIIINYASDKIEVLRHLSTRPKFPGSACTKIYRKDFLRKNGLTFPNDRKPSEDLKFVSDCIYNATSYYAFDKVMYEYRQDRVGSITHQVTSNNIDGILSFVEDSIKKYFNTGKILNEKNRLMLSFAAYEYAIVLWYAQKVKQNEGKFYYFDRISKAKVVSKFGRTPQLKGINLMINILGIRMTAQIIYIIKRR